MEPTLQQIADNRETLLAELNRRQGIVRDYVRAVARQYATGLYLFGRPGTAKTHTVRAVLEQDIREPYTYQRGHLTPMGLFELIAEHPDDVIVLDDLTSVLDSDVALQILLSALEHPAPGDRTQPCGQVSAAGPRRARGLPWRSHLHLQPGTARRRDARGVQKPGPHPQLRSC